MKKPFVALLSLHFFVEQASNKSQLGRRYSNPNLVHRNARLDNSHYYIFIRGNGAYQTNPIHQANVAYKYSWYVFCILSFYLVVYTSAYTVHRTSFFFSVFLSYGIFVCVYE